MFVAPFLSSLLVLLSISALVRSNAPNDASSQCIQESVPDDVIRLLDSNWYRSLLNTSLTPGKAGWTQNPPNTWIGAGNNCARRLKSCNPSSTDWLVTQYINRVASVDYNLEITVDILGNTESCTGCNRDAIEIRYFPTDGAIGTDQQFNAEHYNSIGSLSFSGAASTKSATFFLSSQFDRFYIAFLAEDVCFTLRRLRVSYRLCPAMTEGLVIFPDTPIGSEAVATSASCDDSASLSPGSSLDVTCNTDGTYSGSPSCSCREGDIPINGICSACDPGTFAGPGDTTCTPCAAGSYSGAGATSCTPCSAGSYSGAGATSCIPCDAGEFSASDGATSCTPCAAGTYSGAGATSCIPCDAGEFSTSDGATSCMSCPAGTFSGSGAASCTDCDAGSVSGSGASSCTPCTAGSFAEPDASTCTPCDAGEFSMSDGATSCETCPAGSYSESGATSCPSCPANSISDPGSSMCTCISGYSRPSAGEISHPCERDFAGPPPSRVEVIGPFIAWGPPNTYTGELSGYDVQVTSATGDFIIVNKGKTDVHHMLEREDVPSDLGISTLITIQVRVVTTDGTGEWSAEESIPVTMLTLSDLIPALLDPEPELNFVSDSPIINGRNIEIHLSANYDVTSLQCSLVTQDPVDLTDEQERSDCTSGSVSYSNLPIATYKFYAIATLGINGRTVTVETKLRPENDDECTVHLINKGLTTSGSSATIEYAFSGEYTQCQFDKGDFFNCTSPFVLSDLTPGTHVFKIVPLPCSRIVRHPLKLDFKI